MINGNYSARETRETRENFSFLEMSRNVLFLFLLCIVTLQEVTFGQNMEQLAEEIEPQVVQLRGLPFLQDIEKMFSVNFQKATHKKKCFPSNFRRPRKKKKKRVFCHLSEAHAKKNLVFR